MIIHTAYNEQGQMSYTCFLLHVYIRCMHSYCCYETRVGRMRLFYIYLIVEHINMDIHSRMEHSVWEFETCKKYVCHLICLVWSKCKSQYQSGVLLTFFNRIYENQIHVIVFYYVRNVVNLLVFFIYFEMNRILKGRFILC